MSNKPAILGGEPVRTKYLTFGAPLIEEEEIKEVVDTLRSGWLSTGPKAKRFEKEFAEYIGCKHAIAVNSCTAALHLCLVASDIGEGDEVITTPMTFAATANVIVHQKATPVFVDIEEGGFNIDPNKIAERVTRRTKAIIPMHFAGLPCKMDEILKIAREHGLKVIEDAAHAIGTQYKGRKVGTFGDMTCFSFYVTKNLATAEGGMITTDDELIAKRSTILSLHGMSLDAWGRYSVTGFKHYEIIYPGYKYNMTDIAAALGLHQLAKLEKFIEIRQQYAKIYREELSNVPELILPKDADPGDRHAWHLYPVMIKPELLKIDRNEFLAALHAENVGVGIHFIALHLHPYYRDTFGFKRGDFPNAEFVSDRVMSLPLYPKMTEQDVADVVKATKKLIQYYRR